MIAKKMLVVDDVPEILTVFERVVGVIAGALVEVTTATDASHAIALVEKGPYDIVISDYRMPSATGLEVLAAARRSNPHGRRVLMTGYNELPASGAEYGAAGIGASLQKPFSTASVLGLLRACLSDDPDALAKFRQED